MAAISYEEGKKAVVKGLILLAVVTVAEVAIALVGNGHVIEGLHFPKWIMYPIMIGLSLYKAYFIVYEFMHMGHEMKGLRLTVLGPLLILIWGMYAFLQEGNAWGENKARIRNQDKVERVTEMKSTEVQESMDSQTKNIEKLDGGH